MSGGQTENTDRKDGLISIIVPMYRAGDYISDTISNVASQTFREWELILVDDHSPDDTLQRIQSSLETLPEDLCGRIHIIKKDRNEGAAAARNDGIDASSGRYVAFLDADDVWLPERLEKSLEHMKKTGAGFVFSAYEFGDEQARGTGRVVHVPVKIDYKRALSRTVIFTSTTLFDTEIVPAELIHMPQVASEDTATWWQILRAGYTAYGLDEVLAVYRRPQASLSSNKFKAMARIWNLYRQVEHLSFPRSVVCFAGWACRATLRRL